jgi:hypothetical protein
MIDVGKIKIIERHARVTGPLIRLLNERWPAPGSTNKQYLETVERVQEITQEILNLITRGLL